MPKTRPPYPPEFKAEAVKLARSSGKLLLGRNLPQPSLNGQQSRSSFPQWKCSS